MVKKTRLPEMHDPEGRKALSEVVMALFERWRVGEEDQLVMLGLSGRSDLEAYKQGAPFKANPDLLERIGHLLAIDRALKQAYPAIPEFRNQWIKIRDVGLDQQSPLEVIRCQGMEGLRKVRHHLERGLNL